MIFQQLLSQYIEAFSLIGHIFSFLNKTALYWLPFVLVVLAWSLWMDYVRADYMSKMEWILLEVKLPKDIFKSPLAMEVFLSSLQQPSTGTWFDRRWKGRVKTWYSLELVSFEGKIHFFVRTEAKFKNLIEAEIYAQYPGVEIYESRDYALEVDPREWSLWGTEFILTKPDPYPIKTYVDYGMDRLDLEDEYKIDPMAPMIEFLGGIGKNEMIWVQIMVQATGSRFSIPGSFFGKQDWKGEAKRVVKALVAANAPAKEGDVQKFGDMPKGEQDVVAAIQRSIGKIGFDCGFRALYFAREGTFNSFNIPALVSSIKQYNAENLNGFKPNNTTDFDYPWQDPFGTRLPKKKSEIFDAYVHRGYFYQPYRQKPFVLNTEELATIYHFPGKISEAPGFTRIESKKAEPPSNLPV